MTRAKDGIRDHSRILDFRLLLIRVSRLLSCLARLFNFVSMLRSLITLSRSMVSIVSDPVTIKFMILICPADGKGWQKMSNLGQALTGTGLATCSYSGPAGLSIRYDFGLTLLMTRGIMEILTTSQNLLPSTKPESHRESLRRRQILVHRRLLSPQRRLPRLPRSLRLQCLLQLGVSSSLLFWQE